ncbi:ROK family transcriptional regulator [Celerinatantimonas yamalensis]|uniref:ROK family transcriptional regulator n=1 Tax=Celerinatantimonas yamalensis TaxID=559956 RepID=A0ABW9GAJ2_9GAMM
MTLSGTNLEHAKVHNRRVVIETIRLHGQLTRAEIARLTHLTPQTVSNITRELEQTGWLQSHQPIRSGRGQPAIPLSIAPDGAYSIGIHLDQGLLTIIVADLAGHALQRCDVSLQSNEPSDILGQVKNILHKLRHSDRFDWQKVLGIGWVMPGPFNVRGISSAGPTTLHGWENININNELETEFGFPVWVANDATAAALGERLYGVATQLHSFVYLFINNGLGAGIYLNGHIYDGCSHNAGEIGHIIVQPQGRLCFCGNQGCLERYLSLQAAYELCQLVGDEATPQQLLRIDDEQLEQWLQVAVCATRQAVNIVECLFDAEAVILGGMIPEPILAKLVNRLAPLPRSVRSRVPDELRVRIGQTGLDAAALGAAALPILLIAQDSNFDRL